MSERRHGAGSHWARAQVRRLRSSSRCRRCRIQVSSFVSTIRRGISRSSLRAAVRRRSPGASGLPPGPRSEPGGAQMVAPRCARLRLPPGAQAPAAPTSSPGLVSPPRARWAPGAALTASRLSRGGRRTAIGPDLEPSPRPDLRPSSSASSSLAPSRRRDLDHHRRRRGVAAEEQLVHRSGWGSLSSADRIAKASESPTGKRLPPPRTCGGERQEWVPLQG
ncbi:uncharacterized protein [Manis javanica]|uniref:uncharacterized protein isoform X1 n=1 Tax=Manis javanica TaxID=9974 RepID=UPI003C6CE658